MGVHGRMEQAAWYSARRLRSQTPDEGRTGRSKRLRMRYRAVQAATPIPAIGAGCDYQRVAGNNRR